MMDESKVAKRLLEEQIKKIMDCSKMVKWPEEEEKKEDPLLQEAIQKQQARTIKQEPVNLDVKSNSSTDTESENDFCVKTENEDDYDKNLDYLINEIYTEDNLKDNERTDDQEAGFNIGGPLTSTGRFSKRQIIIKKSSKGLVTGPKAEVTTAPLRIITKKLNCTVSGCKKVVKSRKSLNRHLLSAHQFKEYRCLMRRCHDQASASFATRNELTTHIRQVHGNLSRWTCICSKKVKSYSQLKHHYWLTHELGTFACSKEDCTFKSTSTRAIVEAHQENAPFHAETRLLPCLVDGCGKRFKLKGHLERHTLTHAVERSLACPQSNPSSPK